MDKIVIAFLVGIGLSVVTVLGDSFVKHASLQTYFSGWKWLLLGALVYGATAFGWFYVMRHIKLATTGVLYAVSCVVMLTMISIFYFKEKVSVMESFAILLAIVSLAILFRFA